MNAELALVALSAFLLVMELVAVYRKDGVNVFGYWAAIVALMLIAATIRL